MTTSGQRTDVVARRDRGRTISILKEVFEVLFMAVRDETGRTVVDAVHGLKVWEPLGDLSNELQLALPSVVGTSDTRGVVGDVRS